MAEVKKFLFDNFTIGEVKKEKPAKAEEIAPVVDIAPKEEIIVETFSKEELEQKVQEARDEAYQKAMIDAAEKANAQELSLLTNINNGLQQLLKEDSNSDDEYKESMQSFGLLIIEKLIPTLQKQEGQNIIKQFLEDNFKNFKVEKKLSISIHPENTKSVGEVIAKLADKNDFEGKISIIKDEALTLADCKVLWDNGGVALVQDDAIEEIKEIIKE